MPSSAHLPIVAVSLLVAFAAAAPAPAAAQTGRRLSLGAAVTVTAPTLDAGGASASISPLVRWRGDDGWGPTLGFPWFSSDLTREGVAGELTIRPVMGGLSYTVTRGRTSTSFSLLGGYSFNRFEGAPGAPEAARVRNGVAWGPAIEVWHDRSRTWAVMGSIGYVVARPRVVSFDGVEGERWRADALMVQAGVAWGIF